MRLMLLAACCFFPLVLGVIHNLEKQTEDELVEPLAVDISPDDELGTIAELALGPDFFRERRQVGDDGSGEPTTDIGYTTRLNGTSRHYFALVHWTGHPSQVLFIVTMTRRNDPSDSCLWRSTNYGRTFSNDTYKLNDPNAIIMWYYVSPLDSNLVMADSRQGKIFVTRDEGETYVSYDLDFSPNSIKFQSRSTPKVMEGTIPEHMFGYELDSQSLYVSPNLGKSWTFIGSNISRYSWRKLDEEYESNTSLYYERNINETHAVLMVTQDPYNESRQFDPALGATAINTTVFGNEYILVQQPYNQNEHGFYTTPLWVSTYRQPFRKANFPFQLHQEHFALMDSSEHRIFLAVNHSDGTHIYLYISDESGLNYTFSLDDIVTSDDWEAAKPSFDIHPVEGLDGTYIVNVYNRPLPTETDTDTPEPTVITLISYNKGGHWQYLSAPAVDVNNMPTLCVPPDCSLHLRLDTDQTLGYTTLKSKRSAVGLILAQGNIGENLVEDDAQLRVYLSRDGGFSWLEIQQGHWTFQMIALGSIIVMVPKRATVDPVDFLLWSCDEGLTWTHYVFSLTPMRFIGLLPEKGERARRLTLFGYFREVRPFAWLIVELDFSDAVPTQCTYPDDYFEWIPSDGRSDRRCVLGAERTFERRDSSICCYIDPAFQRAISNVSCICSREDYDCALGYETLLPNGNCEHTSSDIDNPPDDCAEGESYIARSGYQKIPGDVCTDVPSSPFLASSKLCPPVAPDGLKLMLGVNVEFSTGEVIEFVLTQESGWTNQTHYLWDFGDGSRVSSMGLDANAAQQHTYETEGVYTVTVTASNDAGSSSDSLTVFIAVVPEGLTINVDGDLTKAGERLVFTLTQVKGFTEETEYKWNFGDDSKEEGGVGLIEHGVTIHSYEKEGEYTVSVVASNRGGMASISLSIYIGVLKDRLTSEDNSKAEIGLEVGVSLSIIMIVTLAAGGIIIFVWYKRRYQNLQGRYRSLEQEGVAPIALSKVDFQDDWEYSKENEADDRVLVSTNDEL